MEFDDAKENIQPLASGRNASILQASITHTSRELNEQRRELEATIHAFNGDDPLEPWCNYVSWIEQMFPTGGKESGLTQVLGKCLRRFESEERYYQDRRMIKMFIKFIYSNKEPLECFQQLFNGGIGTMVADFYIAWAYCYDSIGQIQKADETFRRGIECRAKPFDELKESYQHFRMAVGERVLYKDDNNALQNTNRQLEERRLALSSLRGYRKRKGEVGSIRTGAAIKSFHPGTVENDQRPTTSSSANTRVAVLKDENFGPNAPSKESAESVIEAEIKSSTVIRSIVDTVRHQENEHEPGPWNKVHDKKNAKKLMRQKMIPHEIGFSIHEDIDVDLIDDSKIENDEHEFLPYADEIILSDFEKKYEKPFKYPTNFVNKNRPQAEWVLPITTEVEPDARSFPCYNKCMLYPRSNREFQMEELWGYRFYKKRGIENALTRRYHNVWSVNDINAPFRKYPNFACRSNLQKLDELDAFHEEPHVEGMFVPTTQIYDVKAQEEFQLEELMAREWFNSKNRTVIEAQDMDETTCASSNNEQVQRRKSFFPMRRSMAIRKIVTETVEEAAAANILIDKTDKPHLTFAEKTQQITHENEVRNESIAAQTIQHKNTDSATSKNFNNFSNAPDENNVPVPAAVSVETASTDIENDFPFKLPAPPTKSLKTQNEVIEAATACPVAVVTTNNKLPFEIFIEDNTFDTPNAACLPASTVQNAFDAEETCSTQMFNICLQKQSASTPKVEQKTQKRQFNVLREVEPPIKATSPAPAAAILSSSGGTSAANSTDSPSESSGGGGLTRPSYSLSPQSPVSPDTVAVTANSFSPPLRKQLSTILETSEHGTHSAATTKSSNGTHMTAEISEATAAYQTQKTQIELTENTHATQQEVTTLMAAVELTEATNNNTTQKSLSMVTTTKHLQSKSQTVDAIDAVATTNATEKEEINQMEIVAEVVDNACENRKPSNMPFTVFEDPTETVPKLMSEHILATNAVAGNFDRLVQCEDSAVEDIAVQPLRFQQDKTETLTKNVGGPRYFYEDKTETASDMLAKMKNTKNVKPIFCDDDYDTLDFFRKSPSKSLLGVSNFEKSRNRFNTHLTPLKVAASKKICIQETPKEFTSSSPVRAADPRKTNFVNTNKDLLDSFMNDFSLSTNSLSTSKKTATKTQQGVVKLRDSFVPEFSIIEDTQQPCNNVSKAVEMPASNVFSTEEASLIVETQPIKENKPQETPKSINCNASKNDQKACLEDLSVIEETQEAHYQQKTDTSKGAIPKKMQLKKSKLHEESLLAPQQPQPPPPKDSFYFSSKHEKTEFSRVDRLLLSNYDLPKENLSTLHDFSTIKDHDEEQLKDNTTSKKLSTNLPNISNQFCAGFDRKSLQKPSESSLAMQDRLKQKQTEYNNSCDMVLIDSILMDTSDATTTKSITSTTTAANKTKTLLAPQSSKTSATPRVDELLESFNKSVETLNFSQKIGSTFKQPVNPPKHVVRESLIPRFSGYKNQTQAEENNKNTNQQKLSFLTTRKSQWPQSAAAASTNMAIFDLNADGDTFASSINLLKNSTMLSKTPPPPVRQSMIQEPSLHIKTEISSTSNNAVDGEGPIQMSSNVKNLSNHSQSAETQSLHTIETQQDEMSIYYIHTPRTPQINALSLSWSDDNHDDGDVEFIHQEVDLNETTQIIKTKCIDPHVNPFEADLIAAFLDNVDFVNFLKREPNTMLVGNIRRLQQNMNLEINEASFKITKLLGQGNYGTVYCGIDSKTGKKYAFKQERPPNYWEYYICLEVQDRIKNDEILLSYMKIEHALIGNKASVFVSAFAPYGSIITVCNKIKKMTGKNVDEYVVMHLTCELLEIIDHLHAADIIHADLKADNFLFMKKLRYNSQETALQLIDFGVSIDMRQFKPTQSFTYVHNDDDFKCIEMREQRPWTYQLDLYGLAGIIHVLLYGKFMEVEKKKTIWLPKQHMPRYINKQLWENIFRTLLNIRDCRLMPNLQELRQSLKQEMAEKERSVISKIAEFNKALDA